MIKAGETLYVGGESEIAALDAQGDRVWTAAVDGAAYGLAVANGHLYVSTDTGAIHCFGNGKEMLATTRKVLPNPFEADVRAIEYRGLAQDILSRAGVKKGTCIMYGCGDGHLAYEIAKQAGELKVFCVDPDGAQVRTARNNLTAAGLYGTRVFVDEGTFDSLDRPAASVDVVILHGETRLSAQTDAQLREAWQQMRQASAQEREKAIAKIRAEYKRAFLALAAEAHRVLRPSGGVFFVELAGQRRGSMVNVAIIRDGLRQSPFKPGEADIEGTDSWLRLRKGK